MTPSCDLARNVSKVSVTVISKHCAGIIKMHRAPLRRTVDQFSDEKPYCISSNIILFIYSVVPHCQPLQEATNVVFKSLEVPSRISEQHWLKLHSKLVGSLSSFPRGPQKMTTPCVQVQKLCKEGGLFMGEMVLSSAMHTASCLRLHAGIHQKEYSHRQVSHHHSTSHGLNSFTSLA